MKDFDAIVIGAGVIGCCVALELARDGRRVVVVDKGAQAGHGSTSASCAIVRTYYSTVESCALAYEGWFRWTDWSGYLDHDESLAVYHDTGTLCLKTESNGYLERTCAMMDEIGCPYEHVAAEDVPKRFPGASLDTFHPPKPRNDAQFGEPNGGRVAGAVFFPRGGYVNDPALAAENAKVAAERAGATFLFRRAVTDILRDGRVRGVRLDDGTEIAAPVVVNVAGPHSSRINAMADVTGDMAISTRAMRHEVAHVKAPDGFLPDPGIVYSDSDIANYMRSDVGGHLLIGSEDPACDGHTWVDDPDEFDRNHSDLWDTYVQRAAQRLPGLGVPQAARGVVDLYDVTEDWAPIYDASSLPGFYMACGTSGNQFKNAPVAGEMMVKLIAEVEDGRDHDADPIDFTFENVGRTISLATYSRRRQLNANSTFSVLG